VQRTLDSEADKNKKIVVLRYQEESQKFIAQKKEDKSLARFLMSSEPPIPSQVEAPKAPQAVPMHQLV
jgi:hypothetical protein